MKYLTLGLCCGALMLIQDAAFAISASDSYVQGVNEGTMEQNYDPGSNTAVDSEFALSHYNEEMQAKLLKAPSASGSGSGGGGCLTAGNCNTTEQNTTITITGSTITGSTLGSTNTTGQTNSGNQSSIPTTLNGSLTQTINN